MCVVKTSPHDYFCEACVRAKHHVAPFPTESTSTYNTIAKLMVTDVWGPARTTLLQGNRYIISFTNMHSQFTTVAFMKSTSEALEHHKAYEALVETQHSC
jgi:hypothetical protein